MGRTLPHAAGKTSQDSIERISHQLGKQDTPVGEVECLLDAVAVVDVDVHVQHAAHRNTCSNNDGGAEGCKHKEPPQPACIETQDTI